MHCNLFVWESHITKTLVLTLLTFITLSHFHSSSTDWTVGTLPQCGGVQRKTIHALVIQLKTNFGPLGTECHIFQQPEGNQPV